MNICLITPRMSIGKEGVLVGGSTVSMMNLTRGLAAKGHRVHVVAGYCTADDIGAGCRVLPDGVEHTAIAVRAPRCTARYGLEFLARSWTTLERLRGADFDIINLHSGFAPYGLAALIASFELKAPSVHTLYCPLRKSATTWLARRVWRKMEAVIAISDNVAAAVRDGRVGPRSVTVIPPAVDTEAFQPGRDGAAFRQAHGLAPDQPVALFVGNMDPVKGLDVLLDAFATVARERPEARLVVTFEFARAGLDAAEARIAELVETLGLSDRIIQLGFVRNMPELMAAADVLVVPFRSTNGPSDYPLPLLEAMSAGRPVIATRVGAVQEIVSDGVNGSLVPPDDAPALATALAAALARRGPDAAATAAARAVVVERFSIPAIADRTERLFDEVIARRPRGVLQAHP